MLPKNRRVQIQSFPRNSRAAQKTKNFVAKTAPNNVSYNRLGVIIGKSSGSAVERNRLRRTISSFFEKNPGFLLKQQAKGKDIVIIASPSAGKLNSKELREEISNYGKLF